MADLTFLQSEEFIKGIRVTSPLLPKASDGSEGLCYDYMDVVSNSAGLADRRDGRVLLCFCGWRRLIY